MFRERQINARRDRNRFGGAKEGEGIEEHVSAFEFGVSNRATVEVDR